jgi:crotonobetainyl-CoA:carnitine CoA-transferase CaiB-like acyl-CoA transferase
MELDPATSTPPRSVPPTSEAQPPLAGYRVLELGNWVAVPFAGSLLGDFGAEVVKVDLPGFIDDNRRLGTTEPADDERSPYFVALARNKKSITLDIRNEAGRARFLELVRVSDVVLSNFRPGTLERWRLGFADLAAVNPHVVLLMVSGYGQSGPMSQEPGLDRIAQAFAGVAYVTGTPDGPPVKCGLGFADYAAGMLGTIGVLLSLLARRRDEAAGGTAQAIDVALYDAILPMLGDIPDRYHRAGEVRERTGNRYPGIAPGNSYRTGDGRWLLMSAAGEALFGRLAPALGHPEWLEDPRFRTMRDRDAHWQELDALIQEWMGIHSADEVMAVVAGQAKVPVSLVYTVRDLLESPQVAAREGFTRLPDPAFGEVLVASPQPKLSRTPGSIRSTGPRPGEHNREIYALLGLADEELAGLHSEGVV